MNAGNRNQVHSHSFTCTKNDDDKPLRNAAEHQVVRNKEKTGLKAAVDASRCLTCGKNGCRMAVCQICPLQAGPIQLTKLEKVANILTGEKLNYFEYSTTISDRDHEYGADRDLRVAPLPDQDSRCLVYNIVRPLTMTQPDPKKLHHVREDVLKMVNDARDQDNPLSAEELQNLNNALDELFKEDNFEDTEVNDILRETFDRNKRVITFSPVLTAAIGCNTAIYHLGAVEQAKAALFYLVKYLNKDTVALTDCLSLIYHAKINVDNYPSTADDTGTAERTATHFLTRILNRLSHLMQISDTQAAAYLDGLEAQLYSHDLWYVHINPCLNDHKESITDEIAPPNAEHFVKKEEGDEDDSEGDDDIDDSKDTLSEEAEEDRQWNEDDINLNELYENPDFKETVHGARGARSSSRQRGAGTSSFFEVSGVGQNGEPTNTKIPVQQHHLYELRGKQLIHMSFYDYCACVKITKIDKSSNREYNAKSEIPKLKKGAKASAVFDFHPDSVLYGQYQQRLNRKLLVPLLAGGHPPKYPGVPVFDAFGKATPMWRKAAMDWSAYILLAMRPYGGEALNTKPDLSWKAFCEYVVKLDEKPTLVNICRFQAIQNIATGLSVSRLKKYLCTLYRNSMTDKWGIDCPYPGDKPTPASKTRKKRKKKELDEAGEALETLRSEARQKTSASARKLLTSKARSAYTRNSLNHLDTLWEGFQKHHSKASSNGDSKKSLKDKFDPLPKHILANKNNMFLKGQSYETLKDIFSIAKDRDGGEDLTSKEKRRKDALNDQQSERPGNGNMADLRTRQETNKDARDKIFEGPMNKTQQMVADRIVSYFKELEAHELDPRSCKKPDPPNLLLHGGPGVGKSFLAHKLSHILKDMKRTILCLTYMGAAANELPNGRTIKYTLQLGNSKSSAKGESIDVPVQPVTDRARATTLQKNVKPFDLYLFDEISMVGDILLGQSQQRIREANGNSLLWGGKPMIAVGDFFQMPPVGTGTVIYKGIVEQHLTNYKKKTICPSREAVEMFKNMEMIQLTQQMRSAEDPLHNADIARHRDLTKKTAFDKESIEGIKELSIEDVIEDPQEWLFPSIAVTSNYERRLISWDQTLKWATIHNLPVIVWPTVVKGAQWNLLTDEEKMAFRVHDRKSLYSSFVPGVPGFLTFNINPEKGLVNGSPIKEHSLSFGEIDDEDPDVMDAFYRACCNAKGGEIIEAPRPPLTLNVECFPDANIRDGENKLKNQKETLRARDWIKLGLPTLEIGKVVLPTFTQAYNDDNNFAYLGPLPGTDLCPKVNVVDFPTQKKFSITFAKLQGKTLPKVCIDPNCRPFQPQVDAQGIHVATTRVRKREDMRRLPLQPGGNYEHITNLLHHPYLALYFAGFKNGEGIWDANLAREYAKEHSIDAHSCIKNLRNQKARLRSASRKRLKDDVNPNKEEGLEESTGSGKTASKGGQDPKKTKSSLRGGKSKTDNGARKTKSKVKPCIRTKMCHASIKQALTKLKTDLEKLTNNLEAKKKSRNVEELQIHQKRRVDAIKNYEEIHKYLVKLFNRDATAVPNRRVNGLLHLGTPDGDHMIDYPQLNKVLTSNLIGPEWGFPNKQFENSCAMDCIHFTFLHLAARFPIFIPSSNVIAYMKSSNEYLQKYAGNLHAYLHELQATIGWVSSCDPTNTTDVYDKVNLSKLMCWWVLRKIAASNITFVKFNKGTDNFMTMMVPLTVLLSPFATIGMKLTYKCNTCSEKQTVVRHIHFMDMSYLSERGNRELPISGPISCLLKIYLHRICSPVRRPVCCSIDSQIEIPNLPGHRFVHFLPAYFIVLTNSYNGPFEQKTTEIDGSFTIKLSDDTTEVRYLDTIFFRKWNHFTLLKWLPKGNNHQQGWYYYDGRVKLGEPIFQSSTTFGHEIIESGGLLQWTHIVGFVYSKYEEDPPVLEETPIILSNNYIEKQDKRNERHYVYDFVNDEDLQIQEFQQMERANDLKNANLVKDKMKKKKAGNSTNKNPKPPLVIESNNICPHCNMTCHCTLCTTQGYELARLQLDYDKLNKEYSDKRDILLIE